MRKLKRNHVLSKPVLEECWKKYPNSKGPLLSWWNEATKSYWRKPSDIKGKFGSADFIPGNRVVFDIGGNNYRIVVKMEYRIGLVFIRFAGTHSEYEKIDAKTV